MPCLMVCNYGNFLGILCTHGEAQKKPPIASLLLGGFLYKVLKLEQSSNQKLIIRITNYKLDIVCLWSHYIYLAGTLESD